MPANAAKDLHKPFCLRDLSNAGGLAPACWHMCWSASTQIISRSTGKARSLSGMGLILTAPPWRIGLVKPRRCLRHWQIVKEKSKDNPLYYVQYCYARISSVFRHVDLNIENDLNIKDYEFEYTGDEIKILKKIAEWPKCIEAASLRLEPHRIPVYLYELSSEFHSYWNMGKEDQSKRFINEQKKISNDKLVFLKVISNVIKSGMNIVGVDTPQKM